MVGGEVEVLLWRADGWMAVPADNMPAPASDGGCTARDPMGAHHKARSTEAGGCMADGASCVAGDAVAEVGRVMTLAELADLIARKGDSCANATAAAGRLADSA